MPDTAVLEAQDTAAAAETPLGEAPPETDETAAPETVDAEGTPETEDESPTFTKADIEAAEKKATERERAGWQKFDKERTEKIQADANRAAENQRLQLGTQQAKEQRLRKTHQGILQIQKQAYDQGHDPDSQALASKLIEHDAEVELGAHALAHYQYSSQRVAAFAEEFPNYRPSIELAQAAERAHDRRDYAAMARIDIRMAAEAARQAVKAEATAEAQAEVAARAAQTPAKPPAKTVAPTNAGSAGGRGRNSWASLTEVATAMQNGTATVADYKAAKAKGLPFN